MTRLRLAFLGTPDFAVPTLAALIEAGHDIACVYSQPPRPAGRGKKLRPSPVHALAERHGLTVRNPTSLKNESAQAEFAALDLDIAVVVAYGLILPVPILEAPRLGCLNLHASLLPRWRGAAPIHRAVMAGDAETGVAVMQMEAGLDTGPVLLEERLPIAPDATTGDVHDTLAEMGAPLMVHALAGLAAGNLEATPQLEDGVTYAAKIDKAEARIDWSLPATKIDRQIRGLSPYPGARFTHDGTEIKVLRSSLAETGPGRPGEVLADDDLVVACGKGAVRLLELQRPGKAPMDADAFRRGYPLAAGDRLE